MSVNYQENKELLKRKAEPFTADDIPEITPEMIRHHIAEGHRLRAEMLHKLSRKAFRSVARASRRMGQTVTGWARNRRYWPPGDQELRSR